MRRNRATHTIWYCVLYTVCACRYSFIHTSYPKDAGPCSHPRPNGRGTPAGLEEPKIGSWCRKERRPIAGSGPPRTAFQRGGDRKATSLMTPPRPPESREMFTQALNKAPMGMISPQEHWFPLQRPLSTTWCQERRIRSRWHLGQYVLLPSSEKTFPS